MLFPTRHVQTDATMPLIMTILVNVIISAVLIMTVVQIMEIFVQDQVILVEAFNSLFHLLYAEIFFSEAYRNFCKYTS